MNGDQHLTNFTSSISKFINKRWPKVRSSRSLFKPSKILDQLLEEEYETLLREIDYLTTEKSCYLSFKNSHFNNGKSSDEIAKILNKHSEEVLKTYIVQNDERAMKSAGTLITRNDLVGYMTKIIVSKPKCNNKLCTCKPIKSSKEVVTENLPTKGMETQTSNIRQKSQESAPNISKESSIGQNKSQNSSPSDHQYHSSAQKSQNSNDLMKEHHPEDKSTNNVHRNDDKGMVSTQVQTDDWDHDPNCICGCCPHNNLLVTSLKSNRLQESENTTTSDRVVTASKSALANCTGEAVEIQISSGKICLPEKFDSLLIDGLSYCSTKKDCSCEAYDTKEAVKRGIVLPSSDACIQGKKASKNFQKKSNNVELLAQESTTSSESQQKISSSIDGSIRKNKKKNSKKKEKTSSDEWRLSSPPSSRKPSYEEKERRYETRYDQRRREEKKSTGCFGKKKKKGGCDQYCEGIHGRHTSIQTEKIIRHDRSEDVDMRAIDTRAVHTSTKAEMGTQPSHSRQLVFEGEGRENEGIDPIMPKNQRTSKETYPAISSSNQRISKEIDPDIPNNERSTEKSSSKDQSDNRDKFCIKCGRKKRDCTSSHCRNTIIIPYGLGSNGRLESGEADSLKMLIKMQSKETNRQFDNVLVELNNQKSEIRRLNEMYQKMLENFYDQQKSVGSSRSQSKNVSDTRNACACPTTNPVSHMAKECGCSHTNECKIKDGAARKSTNNSIDSYGKRFGPPNTSVAINLCDTCNVDIAATSLRNSSSVREFEYLENKQRKDHINQNKKEEYAIGHVSLKHDIGAKGDDSPTYKTDSVSTIYKSDRRHTSHGDITWKIDEHFLLSNNIGEKAKPVEEKHEKEDAERPKLKMKFDIVDIDLTGNKNKTPRRTYSSRMLVWLKKSWVTIKTKREKCRRKANIGRIRVKYAKNAWNMCQRVAKDAAAGLWKTVKKRHL